MFLNKLKDEQTLARWKQAFLEHNQPYFFGRYFTADKLYESVNFASELTHVRNPN